MGRRLILAMLLLTLGACASAPPPGSTSEPIPAGRARLVVTRTMDKVYAAYSAAVDVGGERLADVGRGERYLADIPPGRVTVTVSSWAMPGRFSTSIDAQAGKEYRLTVRGQGFATPTSGGTSGPAPAAGNENSAPFRIDVGP